MHVCAFPTRGALALHHLYSSSSDLFFSACDLCKFYHDVHFILFYLSHLKKKIDKQKIY